MKNKIALLLTGLILAVALVIVFVIVGGAISRAETLRAARNHADELLFTWVEIESTTKDLLIKEDLSDSKDQWIFLIEDFENLLEQFSANPSIVELLRQDSELASNVDSLHQLWAITRTSLNAARTSLEAYIKEKPDSIFTGGVLESFGSEKVARKYSVSHRQLVQDLEICASISDESFNRTIRYVVSSVRTDLDAQFYTIRRGSLLAVGLVLALLGFLMYVRVGILTESRHRAQEFAAQLQTENEQRAAAEASLRKQEIETAEANRMLRLVLDTIPVRVFWKDLNLNFLGCNQLFAEDAGKEHPKDLIGQDDYEMSWRDQAELYRSDDRAVLENGFPKLNYEEPQTTSDGVEKWLRTSKTPLRDSAGNLLGILGVSDDITERKKAERELKFLGNFEAMLSEIATEFVGIAESEVEDAVGRALTDFASFENLDRITFLLSSPDDERSFRYEWSRDPGREERYHEFSEVAKSWPWVRSQLEGGRPVLVSKVEDLPSDATTDRATAAAMGIQSFAFVTVARDSKYIGSMSACVITSRRQWDGEFVQRANIVGKLLVNAVKENWAKVDLRRSEDRLNEAQRIAVMGNWEWNVETGTRVWSREMYEIYAVDPDTFSPTTAGIQDFVHPDDFERVAKDVREAVENDDEYDYEFRIVGGDGIAKVVRSQGRVIRNIEGNVTRFFGALQDITEKKAIDEELERYRKELEELVGERTAELEEAQAELVKQERLATLGQLTATVSHELRNPLGTIRGSLYTIKERLKGSESTVAKPIERAERNITRCDNIIEELLDFTRTTQPLLVRTDMDSLLGEIVDEFRNNIDVPIFSNVESGTDALVDKERFRRCIINVLANALDAIKEREDVPDGGHSVLITTAEKESRCVISIKDTGCGITPEQREKIFEPLFSTKSFGVGLGLPIIKQIIEQHGGGLELESWEGSGTIMTLWLPSVDEAVEDGN